MTPATSPTWTDSLDNFGENLIRFSTSLKALEDPPAGGEADDDLVRQARDVAEAFVPAFRATPGLLVASEPTFLTLLDVAISDADRAGKVETNPIRADSLVHEAILGSQELTALLERIAVSELRDPSIIAQIIEPAFHDLVDSTATVGWELKALCHDYRAEVKLAGVTPTRLEELGHGTRPLVHDMAALARQLRRTRQFWYRLGYRLKSAQRTA